MKYINIAFACLLYSGGAFSQNIPLTNLPGIFPPTTGIVIDPGLIDLSFRKCGTWEFEKEDTVYWFTVDTLSKKEHFTSARNWVYKEETRTYDQYNDLIYRPCGGGGPVIYNQYRICSLTGIRQKRQRIITFKYVEAPRTDYEKVTDSLYATTAVPFDSLHYVGISHLGIDTSVGGIYLARSSDSLISYKPKKRKKK